VLGRLSSASLQPYPELCHCPENYLTSDRSSPCTRLTWGGDNQASVASDRLLGHRYTPMAG